jgi:hypothetical protein
MIVGQKNPLSPLRHVAKAKGLGSSEQTHPRPRDDGCLEVARPRKGARRPLSGWSGDINRPMRRVGVAGRPLAMWVHYTSRWSEAEPR